MWLIHGHVLCMAASEERRMMLMHQSSLPSAWRLRADTDFMNCKPRDGRFNESLRGDVVSARMMSFGLYDIEILHHEDLAGSGISFMT